VISSSSSSSQVRTLYCANHQFEQGCSDKTDHHQTKFAHRCRNCDQSDCKGAWSPSCKYVRSHFSARLKDCFHPYLNRALSKFDIVTGLVSTWRTRSNEFGVALASSDFEAQIDQALDMVSESPRLKSKP
jgi:hypothetical protein